jgi:hypothetical protein
MLSAVMLNVTYKPSMLSVIMLYVIMVSVVEPHNWHYLHFFLFTVELYY